MTIEIIVTDAPAAADWDVVLGGLMQHSEARGGPSDKRPLAVLVKDAEGKTLGGLWGRTSWRWLFIEDLWLPETMRGRGLGTTLIQRAEAEAIRRGCIGAWLDTFDFQAGAGFYENLGYSTFGTIQNYPPGHSRSFLQKTFNAES
jgi:GNAT superfamily N-acetyltransferase